MDYFESDEQRKLGSVALCAEELPFCTACPIYATPCVVDGDKNY